MIGDINQTIFKKNNFKISNNTVKKEKGDKKKKYKKKIKKDGKIFEKRALMKSPEKISSRLKKIFAKPNTK